MIDLQTLITAQGQPHKMMMGYLAESMKAKSYLEVGVKNGASLFPVVHSANETLKKLVLCDEWGSRAGGSGKGSHDHIENGLVEQKFVGEVKWLDGNSREVLPRFIEENPCLIDLTHVDADHSYEGALADMRDVWKVTGEMMVVHDTIFLPNVYKAFCEFASTEAVHALCVMNCLDKGCGLLIKNV